MDVNAGLTDRDVEQVTACSRMQAHARTHAQCTRACTSIRGSGAHAGCLAAWLHARMHACACSGGAKALPACSGCVHTLHHAQARIKYGRNELEAEKSKRIEVCLPVPAALMRLLGAQAHSPPASRSQGDHHPHRASPPNTGTPLWKLVLKQFDDLLVKVGP